MKQLINEIKLEAMSYNKFLTNEYLDKISPEDLLAFTHPLYREALAGKLELLRKK